MMTEREAAPAMGTGKRLQIALAAAVVALALSFALRLTTVSAGVRTGLTFVVFAVLDRLIYERMTRAPSPATTWIKFLGLVILTAFALAFVASL